RQRRRVVDRVRGRLLRADGARRAPRQQAARLAVETRARRALVRALGLDRGVSRARLRRPADAPQLDEMEGRAALRRLRRARAAGRRDRRVGRAPPARPRRGAAVRAARRRARARRRSDGVSESLPLREALALGVLHGPAELLPISSSGHVALVPWLAGWRYR